MITRIHRVLMPLRYFLQRLSGESFNPARLALTFTVPGPSSCPPSINLKVLNQVKNTTRTKSGKLHEKTLQEQSKEHETGPFTTSRNRTFRICGF